MGAGDVMLTVADPGLSYRRCLAGDLPAIHAMLRGGGDGYEAILGAVGRQLDADDADDYRALRVGTRVLVAVRGSKPCGMVKATVDRRQATEPAMAVVEAWSADPAGPEEALDFAGDALAWLRDLGVRGAHVKAHSREHMFGAVSVPARVAAWTYASIPLHPLGTPRDLTWLDDA